MVEVERARDGPPTPPTGLVASISAILKSGKCLARRTHKLSAPPGEVHRDRHPRRRPRAGWRAQPGVLVSTPAAAASLRCVVVGGSLVGLSTAIALARLGLAVTV